MMVVRFVAVLTLCAAGVAFGTGHAQAQYSPPPPDRYYVPVPPGRLAPPIELEDDDAPVAVPPSRGVSPPPPNLRPGSRNRLGPLQTEEAYSPPPPVFIPPDSEAPPPGPYGHIPSPPTQRSELPSGTSAPPRPPLEIAPGQGPEPSVMTMLPPEDQPEVGEPKQLPPQFRRQLVDYRTKEPAGTIIIDTPNTFLYLVLGDGKAMRYGIGVGREGFTWSGTERVSRMAEWPDWHPPEEMIERQPYLPRFMAGGPGNPLGARALYLGKTLFRIHGTNQPSTIGQFVSSGCVRLVNDDIEDLFNRVKVGTRVVVLPGGKSPATAQAQSR